MIEVLLYTTLSCSQINELISNVKVYSQRDNVSQVEVHEIIDVLKESSPECFNERSKQH